MKHKKLFFSLILLCILALSAMVFGCFFLKISPKKKVIKALTDTCTSLTFVTGTSSDQFIGMDKINTILEEQSAQVNGDFTIDFINKMSGYQAFEGFVIAFDTKKDLSRHEASLELSLGKEKPLKLINYLTDDSLVFSVPNVLDENYFIKFSSIQDFFKDSFLMEELGMGNFTIKPFSKPEYSPFSKVFSVFLTQRKEDWKALFSDITLKKTGTKKLTTLDGVKKCSIYEVSLPKESITDFLDSFEDYVHSHTASELCLSPDAYDNFNTSLTIKTDWMKEHLTEDVTFSLAIDSKGRLREFSISYDKFSFLASFNGTKQNTDALSTELNFDHKTHPVTLVYEESLSNKKKEEQYENRISLFLSNEPEKKIELTTQKSFSKDNLKFTNSTRLVIPSAGINAEYSYEGVFTDFVKNQSFSADILKLELKLFGLRIFSLSGELSISPLKEAVTPTEAGVDLFTLSRDKWEDILKELKNIANYIK